MKRGPANQSVLLPRNEESTVLSDAWLKHLYKFDSDNLEGRQLGRVYLFGGSGGATN